MQRTLIRGLAGSALVMALLAAQAFGAVTLTPLPGSTPQTAHPLANVPNPVGVVATSNGVPVANLPITFQLDGYSDIAVGGTWVTVNTDANGVATLPPPGATAWNNVGVHTWNAAEPGGATATFTFTTAGGIATQVVVVSGAGQTVAAGSAFPQPFVAKVLDSSGAPIPYSPVSFVGPPSGPSGTFDNDDFVLTDASGIAVSSRFTANTIIGSSWALAYGSVYFGPGYAQFPFTIVSAPKTWVGGTTGVWSNPANWQPAAAPIAGDQVVFPAGPNVTSTNDIAGLSLDSITAFSPVDVSGNALTLNGANPLDLHAASNIGVALRLAADSPVLSLGGDTHLAAPTTVHSGTLKIAAAGADVWVQAVIQESQVGIDATARNLYLNVGETSSYTGPVTIATSAAATIYSDGLGQSTSAAHIVADTFNLLDYDGRVFTRALDLFINNFTFSASELAGPIALRGGPMVKATANARISGAITGGISAAIWVAAGSSTITLSNSGNAFYGFEVLGDAAVGAAGTLPASGPVMIYPGGHLNLGTYPQSVNGLGCAGTLSMTPLGPLTVAVASGLNNCQLQLTAPAGYVFPSTDVPLIINTANTPTDGTFAGLREGAAVTVNGTTRTISYLGGSGHDIVLKAGSNAGPPSGPTSPAIGNVQDMWWNPSENGWGMSLIQHNDTLFGAFYIYDSNGKPTWFVMPGGSWDPGHTIYSGSLYQPTGTPFFAYDVQNLHVGSAIGTVAVTFQDSYNAIVDYSIAGVSGRKFVTREIFANGAIVSPVRSDLWWGGSSQNGWGITVLQQASTLFAVWYTYDANGHPAWYVMPGGAWTASDTYEGTLYRTTGAPWVGKTYDPSKLQVTNAGTFKFQFNGDSATFTYSADGHSGSIPLVREPF